MRSSAFDPIQILEIFMTVGGIPYYLDKIRKGRSAAQNVDGLSFVENAALRNEFGQLYAALFEHHDATFEDHRSVLRWVKPLARTKSGPSWWLQKRTSPAGIAWAGYAFENTCLTHVAQIKKALGISGVLAEQSADTGADPSPGNQAGERRSFRLSRRHLSVNCTSVSAQLPASLRACGHRLYEDLIEHEPGVEPKGRY
jgi:hypothetical protein